MEIDYVPKYRTVSLEAIRRFCVCATEEFHSFIRTPYGLDRPGIRRRRRRRLNYYGVAAGRF